MKIVSCNRVDNHTYLVQFEGHKERVMLDVKSIELRNRSNVVNALFQRMSEKTYDGLVHDNAVSLKINGKNFDLEREKGSLSAISAITNFVVDDKYAGLVRLKLSSQALPAMSMRPIARVKTTATPDLLAAEPLWRSDPQALRITPREEPFKQAYANGLFSDPYTALASHAFQNYSEDFAQREEQVNARALVVSMKKLSDSTQMHVLSKAADVAGGEFLSHSEVVSDYFQQLIIQWGPEKVDVVQYRYGINLQDMMQNDKPLTVDVIYKMNIGLGLVEIQDVQKAKIQLAAFIEEIAAFDGSSPLTDAAEVSALPVALTARFVRHLEKELGHPPSIMDALDWCADHPAIATPGDCVNLDAAEFSILLNICQPDGDERGKLYTGRKLGGFVDSAYTLADGERFMPWLDDQEFSECCEQLLRNTSWEFFAQQLALVICKKHLMHRHPDKGYYVGALVPAPAAGGRQEWYRVTSCINSGTGNLSYTLEPAVADSALPAIKLFRSTASSGYAFDSQASVRSDTNPLNAPGYEGQVLVEEYERDLFLERTIPIWVGYQHRAAGKIVQARDGVAPITQEGCEELAGLLDKSTMALQEDETKSVKPKDTRGLIRGFDWIVLNYLRDCCSNVQMDPKPTLKETYRFFCLVKKYAHKLDESAISDQEQRKDARFIYKMLKKNPNPDREKVCELLKLYVTTPHEEDFNLIGADAAADLRKMTGLKEQYEAGRAAGLPPSELFGLLSDWSELLHARAFDKHETVAQKKNQKIVCVGHSLGGALAQRTLAKYTLMMGRMPLPDQAVELYDFAAPGINADDNDAFISMGNKHADFLLRANRPFVIHRRQIAGDFVPLAGVVHLGATFSHEDALRALSWLDFDAQILVPNKDATHPGITDTAISHGMQVIGPSYGDEEVARRIEGAASIPFDTAVQGSFNRGDSTLHKELWRLDNLISFAIDNEKKLALVRTALRAELFGRNRHISETSHPLHGAWYENTDASGVFVVRDSGLSVH